MNIDINLIGNVLIAMFLYNMILKAIGAALIKQIMKGDVAQKKKKTFREELKKKLDKQSSRNDFIKKVEQLEKRIEALQSKDNKK